MLRLPPDHAVPTLSQMQKGGGWIWLVCDRCMHRRPFALAQLVILWGPDASSNLLRRRARCRCGSRGASTQKPSWHDSALGFEDWPVADEPELEL